MEFYSNPRKIFKGQKLSLEELKSDLKRLGYRQRNANEALANGDYVVWDADQCESILNGEFVSDTEKCLGFKP
ncbi:MAG: hypothetical protein KDD25_10450, partial [Bdellovibrionales bacterium]|nr:hypothetical protein [Bdellovibrionales bacterium]